MENECNTNISITIRNMESSKPNNINKANYALNKKQWEFKKYCRTGLHPSESSSIRTTTERIGNQPPITREERDVNKLIELCDDKEALMQLTNTLHLMYLERHNKYNPYKKPAIMLKTGNTKITDTFKTVKKAVNQGPKFKGFSERKGCKYTYKNGKLDLIG